MSASVMQTPQLTTGRLLLLGASSVILCLSFVMSVFAPFPLVLALLLYGRTKGILIGMAGLLACYLFASVWFKDLTLVGFYFFVLVFAAGIFEVVKRNVSPVKGLVAFGLMIVVTLGVSFGFLMNSLKTNPKDFLTEQIQKSASKIEDKRKELEASNDEDAIQLLQLFDRPDQMAAAIVEAAPSFVFNGIFIILWFNMFLVLKSRRLLFSGNDYPHSENELINFKVPFGFVFVLVVGLVLAVWGDKIGAQYDKVGTNIISCLGIFYFFQGFGVFSDLLNFVGIFGFFRVIFTVLTIWLGSPLIALAGLFDNWFDFRKYFVKRKTED